MTRPYPDRENTLSLLADWQAHHAAVTRLMDGLSASPLGLDPNSSMIQTVWNLFDAYTVAMAHQLGDHGKWLEWFHGENEMGVNGHAAGYDGQRKPIKTLGDLYDLIAESRRRAAA